MGRLSRRVKFIAKERRLSVPSEFLQRSGLERGDTLRIATRGGRLFVFTSESYHRFVSLQRQLDGWFQEAEHPFFGMLRAAIEVRVGSQDRVVLPRRFAFQSEETIRLHWQLLDDFLMLEPEQALPETAVDPGPQLGLSDFAGGHASFAPEEVQGDLESQVPLREIRFYDRTFAHRTPVVSEALMRSIRVEGIREPILLRKLDEGGFQILDGFRRVAAARALKLRRVPALVWENLDDRSATLICLTRGSDENEDGSASQRMRAAVRLHSDQVGLAEIEKITGRRKRTLQRYIRVAQDEVLRDAIERQLLSIFKAEEILKAGIDPAQAIREKWTVRRIREEGALLRRSRGAKTA